MNVERTSYELALLKWAQHVLPSDWVVIFEDADGPRPPARYVTLKVLTMPSLGEADKVVYDAANGDDFSGQLQVHYEATCSVNVFGATARSEVERLRASVDLPGVLELTGRDGLSIVGSTASVNQTELDGTRSVPRFQADIFFHWSEVTHYEGEAIESVAFTEI